MKKNLKTVTLLGIDCVNIERLVQVAEICLKDFDFAEVKLLTSLPSDNHYVVKIDQIASTEDYSKFIFTDLDKYVYTSHVLIIQYDGFILNQKAWSNEFLQYDYIGTPWKVADWSVKFFDFPEELLGQWVVGNGGFSLRSKKLTTLCSNLYKEGNIKRYHPEDTAICVYNRELFENAGLKFAPVSLAKRFSYEE
jgi:hypothetical protein